jgi:hypothetical protein
VSSPKSPSDGGIGSESSPCGGRVYDPDLAPSQLEMPLAKRLEVERLHALLAAIPEDPLNDAPAAVPLAPRANGALVTEGEEAASAYVPPARPPTAQPLEAVRAAKVQLGGRGGSRTAATERIQRGGETVQNGLAQGLPTDASPWQVASIAGVDRVDKALLPSGVRAALIVAGLVGVVAAVWLWVLRPKITGGATKHEPDAAAEGSQVPPAIFPTAPGPNISAPPIETATPSAALPARSSPSKALSSPNAPAPRPTPAGAKRTPEPPPEGLPKAAPPFEPAQLPDAPTPFYPVAPF